MSQDHINFFGKDPRAFLKSRYKFTDEILEHVIFQGHVIDFAHIYSCCDSLNLEDEKTKALWQIVALSKNAKLIIHYFNENPVLRNVVDSENRAVLHYLALSGDFNCLKTFVETYRQDISLDVKDNLDNTVLSFAQHADNQAMINFLSPQRTAFCVIL